MLDHRTREGVAGRLELVLVDRGVTAAAARTAVVPAGRLAGVLWAIALVIEVRSILLLNGASGDGQATAVGVLLIVSLLTANIARRLTASMHDRRARAVLTAAPATT